MANPNRPEGDQKEARIESGARENIDTVTRSMDELGERTAEGLEVVSQSSGVLINGAQQITREMTSLNQELLNRSFNGHLFSIQADLARNTLELSFEGARRIGEILIRMSEEAQRATQRASRSNRDDDREKSDRQQRGQRAA
jgi:hypothetical protein